MITEKRYAPEVRERAVQMVLEHQSEHGSQWAAIGSIGVRIGCTRETLRRWVRHAQRNRGLRAAPTTEGRERIKALEREVRELRQANEILRKASAYFAQADLDRRSKPGKAFIDENKGTYGVEPICKVLPIAPSRYYTHAARQADSAKAPPRVQRDAVLGEAIRRVRKENFGVYGVRKVWRQLRREGQAAARCTVARLMEAMGSQGVIRDKPIPTNFSDKAAPCPMDRVNRQFQADRPNALWVSDFTYVSTWQGFVYVAFVIDVFARRIVGWKVSTSARTDFVLEALGQALYARQRNAEMIHHSDRGVPYVSIRYTERLAEAGIEPSVGNVGDSYDNALAETINGSYKAEVIHRQSWKSPGAVETATLTWVDWFNHRRLLEPIGNIPPAEAEANYYRQAAALPKAA